MRYELMNPRQIRTAIDKGWPCILPLGVLEYHSGHLGVGMDTLAVERTLYRLEKEMEIVILPSFYYGAASFAVAPPERKGTVNVPGEALGPFAKSLFAGLLRVGFRNIHGIVHHQSENFDAGMPTDLAFKNAARQAIFEFLDRDRGEGWWGRPEASDYYEQHAQGDDPFSWIRFHPLMNAEVIRKYAFDHAGIGETSLMMALCPEAVDMGDYDEAEWFAKSAKNATPEFGERGVALIIEYLKEVLS